jgi:hypothetical protein
VNPLKQRKHQPNRDVSAKFGYALKEAFLRFLGDLKFFRRQPRFLVLPNLLLTLPLGSTLLYDPRSYRIKGHDMRAAMKDIQPGDILVRGFDDYVDGTFIPGFFSHVGLYLGKVDKETIKQHWNTIFAGGTIFEDDYAPLEEVLEKAVFGEQMVIHSMKDGIFMEDLLNFCRCDYMAAVRFPQSLTRNSGLLTPYSESKSIKQTFTGEELEIAHRLLDSKPLSLSGVFPVMFKLALSQLGKKYDFALDFSSFTKMSCTEFVYYCTKSLEWCSGIHPTVESVAYLKAAGIAPDSFVGSPKLEVSFASQSVVEKNVIPQIKARYPGPYGKFSR